LINLSILLHALLEDLSQSDSCLLIQGILFGRERATGTGQDAHPFEPAQTAGLPHHVQLTLEKMGEAEGKGKKN